MSALPLADADPDLTTQIPWPTKNRHRIVEAREDVSDIPDFTLENEPQASIRGEHGRLALPSRELHHHRLTTWNLITLTIAVAGSQVAWTVEFGYGTPFLLSLGLSEQLTSLVWLAGPLSGLITQPVIGAISDSSTSKYRRRYWIVLSTVVLVLSTLCLAYCQPISALLVDFMGGGEGDWDPKRIKQVTRIAIGLAIFSFYLLDFALNALQASLRNLLLDVTPHEQLNAGNAWHGRMIHAGNIVGFGFGFLPLAELPVLHRLGGDQFRKFCVIAMVLLVVTVWVTCWCQEENVRRQIQKQHGKAYEVLENIYTAVVSLPQPIRYVCYVEVFAFMGWFPFLFYATTYVGQIMAYELNKEPDKDIAARTGESAMLVYSIFAVIAGTSLPHLAGRDRLRSSVDYADDQHALLGGLRGNVNQLEATSTRRKWSLFKPCLLRDIWAWSLIFFTIVTLSTAFISTVHQAIVAIGLIGISWAVAMWVPYALIMEFLKEPEFAADQWTVNATVTNPSNRLSLSENENEYQPLLDGRPFSGRAEDPSDVAGSTSLVGGGTVLGVHNLAIVLPQFIIALVSSAIFRAVDGNVDEHPTGNTYLGKNGVAWVLRFGGLCTLIAAYITRVIPPTQTEKRIHKQLEEIEDIS